MKRKLEPALGVPAPPTGAQVNNYSGTVNIHNHYHAPPSPSYAYKLDPKLDWLPPVPPESDVFQDALKTIFTKARAAGVGAGIHQGMPPTTAGMTPDDATRWITQCGCNVYVHAADVNLFATQLARDLKSIRAAASS